MSKKQSKQTFLGGAAVLAAAVLIVKLIGFFYKIPLTNIIGADGKSYFDAAYRIYNVLLTISTAGFPLAISKLTSEAHAHGLENEKRKLFRTAIWLFFILGLVFSVFMFLYAEPLSKIMLGKMGEIKFTSSFPFVLTALEGGKPSLGQEAFWPIRVLSPAVFCVCLLACMRGYTQGQGNMKPTAISQVLEALCKLGIGLPTAYYFYQVLGRGKDVGAAGAILGVTAGTMVSMFFLIVYLLRHWTTTQSLDVPSSRRTLMKKVLVIGVPITLGNSAMSLITLVDQAIAMGQLNAVELSYMIHDFIPAVTQKITSGQLNLLASALVNPLSTSPASLYGQYSMGMDIINLPASFVYPVTMSLIPFAAAALTRNDSAEADRTVSAAFKLIALMALPCGVGLSVLAKPIMVLLYPAQYTDAVAAGPHLQMLGVACIFICIMILTNAILQSYGHERIPILTVVIGGAVKLALNYILVGNPDINIQGAPISTLCCYVVIAGLNLFFVWKYSPKKPHYLAIFAKPILASALMGASAWIGYRLFDYLLARVLSSTYLVNGIATLGGILLGVVVYFVLVLALRILRAEDVKTMKRGDQIIKILHLK